MKKEKRINLTTLTPEQQAAILKAAEELFSNLNMEQLDDFVISYAWTISELGDTPDLTAFRVRTYLKTFSEDICQAVA